MHPTHHEGRRAARARALHTKYSRHDNVAYVDAAEYRQTPRKAFAVVAVNGNGAPLAAASIETTSSETAEEAAIALAIATTPADIIFSDSKTAIRNFARGHITSTSLRILQNTRLPIREVELIWVPAHSSNPGDEAAHAQARGFVDRAVSVPSDPNFTRDGLISFHDIAHHFRLERRAYPPPHKSLSKAQEVTWRRLQTRSLLNPALLALMYPGQYDPNCRKCGERATYDHILWNCADDPPPAELIQLPSLKRWEAVLVSSDPKIQVRAIERANEVAASHGLAAT
uniref:Putative tick transposon n=1 Tax=Amblyomma sculptum TaxID=1581419 RepID=A0A1E1XV07_AMBSC